MHYFFEFEWHSNLGRAAAIELSEESSETANCFAHLSLILAKKKFHFQNQTIQPLYNG